MKIDFDIDIDIGNRDKVLEVIDHIPAAMRNVSPIRKHASGVHITDIPYDPVYDMSSIDYTEAEERGYVKLDLLNVHVYENIKSEEELIMLMRDPDWTMLHDRSIVEQLIHLNNSYSLILKMPEPINSIPRLAMFLAAIRPTKRHLIGKTWKEINQYVWEKDVNGYVFKRAHAIAYSQLVVVHLNLLAATSS